jgi:thymidine phosphorylase
MDTQQIGAVAAQLGAGRARKEDAIDHAAGIRLAARVGDRVQPGQVLATLYTNRPETVAAAEKAYLDALTLSDQPPKEIPLIFGTVR